MPTNDQHCNQFEKNCKFIEIESLKEGFKEWYVTGAFYCSLHLIEGYLDKFKNTSTQNHKERLDLLKRDSFLNLIFSDYSSIYHESLKARYYNKEFTDDDISNINEKLKRIENKLYPKIKQNNSERISS